MGHDVIGLIRKWAKHFHAAVDALADVSRLFGKFEIGRQYADDRIRLASQLDGAADDGGVGAETALPDGIGEHDDPVLAEVVLLFGERAAEARTDSEDLEEVRRDLSAGDKLGTA